MRGSASRKALALVRNPKVSFRKTGDGEAGRPKISAGSCVTVLPPPAGMSRPTRVTAAMPSTIAPGTRRAMSTPVRPTPSRQRAAGPEAKSPCATRVAGLATITPAFFSPMKAMKSPMPAVIASFSECGIAAMMRSRQPVSESARNTTPFTKTIPSASVHGTPLPRTIVNVKNALMPMPGASAIG